MFNVFIAMPVSIIVLNNLFKSNHLLKKTEDTPIHMPHQMTLPDKNVFELIPAPSHLRLSFRPVAFTQPGCPS